MPANSLYRVRAECTKVIFPDLSAFVNCLPNFCADRQGTFFPTQLKRKPALLPANSKKLPALSTLTTCASEGHLIMANTNGNNGLLFPNWMGLLFSRYMSTCTLFLAGSEQRNTSLGKRIVMSGEYYGM